VESDGDRVKNPPLSRAAMIEALICSSLLLALSSGFARSAVGGELGLGVTGKIFRDSGIGKLLFSLAVLIEPLLGTASWPPLPRSVDVVRDSSAGPSIAGRGADSISGAGRTCSGLCCAAGNPAICIAARMESIFCSSSRSALVCRGISPSGSVGTGLRRDGLLATEESS